MKINKFGIWTAIIYTSLVLFVGVFSIGQAFLASSTISGLFTTFILPVMIIAIFINFIIGYYAGILIEKLWRKK